MILKKTVMSSILLGVVCNVNAGELRHQFVNPNFGGNPFNASPLLSNATAQNDYKDPSTSTGSASESFKERLDRAILSRLSRVLVDNAFGEDGEFVEGTIETGLNSISVEEVSGGSLVTITDSVTGQVTIVEVPSF